MYTLWADNVCIFDDTSPDRQHMVVNPELNLSAGAAGSLTFSIPAGCDGYDSVNELMTTLRVERDGGIAWMGRALEGDKDFYKTRSLMCEGAKAWLNDYVIPTGTHTGTAEALLTAILGDVSNPDSGTYNYKAAANRRIAVGTVTVTGTNLTTETDYNSALDAVDKLVSDYGGVLRMRYPAGVPTLDWLADYPPLESGAQGIEFGENLLDFTVGWSLADYATVAIVRGAEYETTVGDQTVKAHYMGGAEMSSAVIAKYGRIEKFLNYSDCGSVQACDTAAQEWLDHQYDTIKVEMTALDLHILNPAIEALDLLQRVPVSSWAHDFSDTFALIGEKIPLYDPGRTQYTMGSASVAFKRRANTLTQRNVQAEAETRAYVDEADSAINARVDSAEGDIATLEITQGQIESRVSDAEDNISTVTQTANEIKLKVADSDGNYNVLTVESGGVTIANGSSATNIDGGFLDADTIHVGKLYGQTIYFVRPNNGGNYGSLYMSDIGGSLGSTLHISFEATQIESGEVYLPSADHIWIYVSGGGYVSLASLLNS